MTWKTDQEKTRSLSLLFRNNNDWEECREINVLWRNRLSPKHI